MRPEEAVPSAEAIDALWAYLVDGGDDTSLSLPAMIARLQARLHAPALCAWPRAALPFPRCFTPSARHQTMSLDANKEGAIGEGPDSLVWKEFALGLGCKPFDRF